MMSELTLYSSLLNDIKARIRRAQIKATLSANAEMILMYWDVGKMIHDRQKMEGWGTGIIPRLSRDLLNAMPEEKGFSERNIKRMLRFYREYPALSAKVPQAVAQLASEEKADETQQDLSWLTMQIPWSQNVILYEKIKDNSLRYWYMQQVITEGWGRDTLSSMIKSKLHERQGAAVHNFGNRLPSPQSELAGQVLKDPYLFDFMTLAEPFHERELELQLVQHIENFLLELGQGFAFVGRQYPLSVGDDDFFLDLLFYHLKLRCFVVVELKRGKFKPEYAGKMNFYCSVVDNCLRHESDQPTIGLILCQNKNSILAEYALRDIHKPIGIADYDFTRALPTELASSLPSVEQIEAELQHELEESTAQDDQVEIN